MLKKIVVFFMCLVFGSVFISGAQAAEAKKITLRLVTPFAKNSPEHEGLWIFVGEVEKKLGDRIEIKYLGGSEVMPAFQQFEMMGKGAFDIGDLPGNYAENFVTIAPTLHLSRLKPWEERSSGVYDILRQEFEKKLNLVYMGKHAGKGYLYQLYGNFEVKTLQDFKGKTLRVAPVNVPHVKALGAGTTSIPPGEIYTAMERKTVDGFGWPTLGVVVAGWAQVTKYRYDPGFYPVGMGIFINGDAWKKIPKDLQDELVKIMQDSEKAAYDKLGGLVVKETKGIQEKGMKILTLPDAEAKKFVDLAFDEAWKDVIKKDAQLGQKMKDLTAPKN
jgi:TRAP-type transport system periplasmic protein